MSTAVATLNCMLHSTTQEAFPKTQASISVRQQCLCCQEQQVRDCKSFSATAVKQYTFFHNGILLEMDSVFHHLQFALLQNSISIMIILYNNHLIIVITCVMVQYFIYLMKIKSFYKAVFVSSAIQCGLFNIQENWCRLTSSAIYCNHISLFYFSINTDTCTNYRASFMNHVLQWSAYDYAHHIVFHIIRLKQWKARHQ